MLSGARVLQSQIQLRICLSSHDVFGAAEEFGHQLVVLLHLPLQLVGVDLEEAHLQAQLAVCVHAHCVVLLGFAIYLTKIRFNKNSREILTLLLLQIVVEIVDNIIQD